MEPYKREIYCGNHILREWIINKKEVTVMQAEEKCMNITGDLFQEFEETRKLAEDENDVTYATWSRVCSTIFTIICC